MSIAFIIGVLWGVVSVTVVFAASRADFRLMTAGDAIFVGAYGVSCCVVASVFVWFVVRKIRGQRAAAGATVFVALAVESLWQLRIGIKDAPLLSGQRLGPALAVIVASFFIAWLTAYLLNKKDLVNKTASAFVKTMVALLFIVCIACAVTLHITRPLRFHVIGGPPQKSVVKNNAPDIVLVTIDTLAFTHTSLYGYSRDTTPNLKRIATRGVLFNRAYTPAPLTTPAHASILTGMSPRQHGVVNNATPLSSSARTLPEYLRERGYDTAAFVDKELCSSFVNFQQGFNIMFLEGANDGPAHHAATAMSVSGAVMRLYEKIFIRGRSTHDLNVDRAISYIKSRKRNRPLFLWVHLYNVHASYDPPAAFRKKFGVADAPVWNDSKSRDIYKNKRVLTPKQIAELYGLYDAEVAWADALVGRLDKALRETGNLKNTMMIIAADHGEMLYERDFYIGHAAKLYEPSVRVPLLVVQPGKIPAKASNNDIVWLTDIFPTVLNAAGVKPPRGIAGIDLVKTLAAPPGKGGHKFSVSETFFPDAERDAVAYTVSDWKLIYSPGLGDRRMLRIDMKTGLEITGSSNDPMGAFLRPAIEKRLMLWLQSAGKRPPTPRRVRELMRELHSLGYAQ